LLHRLGEAARVPAVDALAYAGADMSNRADKDFGAIRFLALGAAQN
jgi:hypothetical protein